MHVRSAWELPRDVCLVGKRCMQRKSFLQGWKARRMYIIAVYSFFAFFFLSLFSFSNLCKYKNLRDLRDPLCPQCKDIDRGAQMPAGMMHGFLAGTRRAEQETKTETLPPPLSDYQEIVGRAGRDMRDKP